MRLCQRELRGLRMKLRATFAALAAAFTMTATAAHADVRYLYTFQTPTIKASLDITLPAPPTSNVHEESTFTSFSRCIVVFGSGPETPCLNVVLLNDYAENGQVFDYVVIRVGSETSFGGFGSPFSRAAFQRNGTYEAIGASAGSTITLETSGVTTLGAIPEPSSWAMMIIGFGLVGGAVRSRRSVVGKAARADAT